MTSPSCLGRGLALCGAAILIAGCAAPRAELRTPAAARSEIAVSFAHDRVEEETPVLGDAVASTVAFGAPFDTGGLFCTRYRLVGA